MRPGFAWSGSAVGPTGVRGAYARRDDLAVVELAEAAGLARLPAGRRHRWAPPASGSVRRCCRGRRPAVARVVLGIGGSASHRRGRAGFRAGRPAARRRRCDGGPRGGVALASRRGPGPRARATGWGRRWRCVACDVDNPLTGPAGRGRRLRAAEGRGPRPGSAGSTRAGHWADVVAGVVEDHRGLAGRRCRRRCRVRRRGGAGRRAPLGDQARPRADGVRRAADGAPTWSSPAKGLSTSRPCTARRRPGSRPPPRHAGVPVVAVCGRTDLDPRTGFARRESPRRTR